MAKVEILLATFNGSQHVSAQIDSILNQSYDEWNLLIHDDGSEDGTVAILESYEKKFPEKIKLVRDDVRTGGAKHNFSHLLRFVQSDYVMFCDQDDIWLPQKIEKTFSAMLDAERSSPNIPILVHSDLKVVDVNLNVISESMFRGQRLVGNIRRLEQILMCNSVTGCTIMFNKTLLNLSPFIPEKAVMHDWWLGCVTLHSAGVIAFVDEPLILYRQHENNTVGYKHFGFLFLMKKFLDIKFAFKNVQLAIDQAKALDESFGVAYLVYLKIKFFSRKVFRIGN